MIVTRTHHTGTRTLSRTLGTLVASGALAAVAVGLAAGPASAATHNWDAVAACESSGNWSTNTGNGFYGGLQFTQSTWAEYGGSGSPQHASRDEQIRVAERVLDGQGPGAWPVCGRNL
ncbi:transglycosylase family protein [Rhodococcus spelaei]|uniref:Transglycosylase family protein n=1 Tax=Rhodococcus spelaei TaxID=2546320 RepID=A0A541BAQ9_9NOCA|nr:transglycosylase family protein [Rhodococcus spelaei]TQF69407.1 transglycosylase family protein [Rhodococcus spelaei]